MIKSLLLIITGYIKIILLLLTVAAILLPTSAEALPTPNEDRHSILQNTTRYVEGDSLCLSDQSNVFELGQENADLPNGIYKTDQSKTNEARVWEFLTSSEGLSLSETSAAGFMGNIKQESGGNFNPGAVEGGTGIGYGIIQWSYGRRTKIESYIAAMKSANPSADLMDIQLSYLRKELTTDYKDTYKMLNSANTVDVKERNGNKITYKEPLEMATMIVHGSSGSNPQKFVVQGLGANFIASGDDLKDIIPGNRYTYAKEYYKKYTGNIVVDSASVDINCSTITSSEGGGSGNVGEYGWDLEGPNKMHYYQQTGQSWSNTKYGTCGTIGVCGCTVVATASIISTLTNNKDNPAVLLSKVSGGYSNVPTQFGLNKTIIKNRGKAPNWSEAVDTIRAGGLILVYAQSGTFTSSQHYFVIRKMSPDGNSFYVYDLRNPDSKINNTAYTKSELLGEGNVQELYGYVN